MCWWIKLHRKITERERYTNSNMVHLFLHIIMSANHKDWKWQWIDVKRWQLITWRKSLSKETWISEQTIRTCLKNLEKSQNLTIKSTKAYSIITVVKYNDYNEQEIKSTNELTNNQPTTNQQLTTNKNDKNVKNEKKTNKKFQAVADYDDFCTRLDEIDYSSQYPTKNIEVEKKKCWIYFDSKNKTIKDAKKTFANRLLPKKREKEYIEWIKEKTDEQWIKEWNSSKTKFMEKYWSEKYSEIKEKFIQQCLKNPLSL